MLTVKFQKEGELSNSAFVQRHRKDLKNFSSSDVPEGKKSVVFNSARALERAGIELTIPIPKYSMEEINRYSSEVLKEGLIVPESYSEEFEQQFTLSENG